MTRQLRAYYLANVAFLVPSGIATIVFPWLVVNVLNETPERVGIAQMISQLPALVFLLLAGLVADRIEQRRILIVTHVLVALGQFGIVLLILTDTLSFEYLLALAVFTGIAGAFSGPPRDALLTRVANGQIQRTVIMVIGLQFGAQIAGFLLAGVADRIGGPVLLSLAALMFVLGVIPCLQLPSSEPGAGPRGHPLRDIGVGLRVAISSPAIAPALVLTFALGVFFVGSFVVLLPLIVRDVYHGGAADLSIAFSANMTGTLIVIGVLMRRDRIQRQGRAFMLALLFGSVVLSFLYLRPPYWAFFVMSFIWGLGGGFTMTMGRSIVQEASPPELAARLVSIYGFAMSAGMPIGSYAIGYAVKAFGTLNAALLPALGMALTVLAVHLMSGCWRLGTEEAPVQQAA
jgi:MFS family permease